jgi:RNA polymerase sigma factor (sigma-70 family)
MVAAMIDGQTTNAEVAPLALRYVSDRRVKTKKAAEDALAVVNWLETREGTDPDEARLFSALQVCAYRAARPSRGRRITDAEREQWARRWKMVRDFVVEQNMGLVYTMMTRFGRRGVDWDEQRSDALYALMRAIDGFNPWHGTRFSTYACNAIGRSLIHLSKRVTKYRSRFPREHEAWLERPQRDDGWSELFADRLHRALAENLGELTDREAAVLGWRFPMSGARELTLGEIGNAIGLSKERARQIQEAALAKLRGVLTTDPMLQ